MLSNNEKLEQILNLLKILEENMNKKNNYYDKINQQLENMLTTTI